MAITTNDEAITIPIIVSKRAHSLNADAESLMSFNHFIPIPPSQS